MLFMQMFKFFIVGGASWIIDFGVLNLLVGPAHFNANVATTISFLISTIFNYFVSMRYVFTRREDMARWMEMTIFLVSSIIALLLTNLIVWIFTSLVLPSNAALTEHGTYILFTDIGKVIATIIVSVWNFGIRKWLLDAPSPTHKTGKTATRLGEFSLKHGPQSKK
jgi:putative flippase GtrA